MGFASFLRDKTKAASESLKQRDWTREQQALSSIKTWGTGCVATRVHNLLCTPTQSPGKLHSGFHAENGNPWPAIPP